MTFREKFGEIRSRVAARGIDTERLITALDELASAQSAVADIGLQFLEYLGV